MATGASGLAQQTIHISAQMVLCRVGRDDDAAAEKQKKAAPPLQSFEEIKATMDQLLQDVSKVPGRSVGGSENWCQQGNRVPLDYYEH